MTVTLLATLSFLLTALSLSAAEGQIFPQLEPRGGVLEGFKWQYENGPDFYTYYASVPSDPQAYVGIYFGIHPKLLPSEAMKAETTVAAGKTVVWYDTRSSAQKFRRDAIVDYRHSPIHLELRLHIWLVAATKEKLSEIMQALGSLQFAEVTRSTKANASKKGPSQMNEDVLGDLAEKVSERVFSDMKTVGRLDNKCPVYLDADPGTRSMRFKVLLEEKLRANPEIVISRKALAGEPVPTGGGGHVHRRDDSMFPEPTPLLEVKIWENKKKLNAAVSPWTYWMTPEQKKANAASRWTRSIEIGPSEKR